MKAVRIQNHYKIGQRRKGQVGGRAGQAGQRQGLRLQHGKGVVLRGVVPWRGGVMPENAALF
jgi:hypothetical protein